MKYLFVLVIAIVTFVGLSSVVAKYQISDSGMVLANTESGTVDPTPPTVDA